MRSRAAVLVGTRRVERPVLRPRGPARRVHPVGLRERHRGVRGPRPARQQALGPARVPGVVVAGPGEVRRLGVLAPRDLERPPPVADEPEPPLVARVAHARIVEARRARRGPSGSPRSSVDDDGDVRARLREQRLERLLEVLAAAVEREPEDDAGARSRHGRRQPTTCRYSLLVASRTPSSARSTSPALREDGARQLRVRAGRARGSRGRGSAREISSRTLVELGVVGRAVAVEAVQERAAERRARGARRRRTCAVVISWNETMLSARSMRGGRACVERAGGDDDEVDRLPVGEQRVGVSPAEKRIFASGNSVMQVRAPRTGTARAGR